LPTKEPVNSLLTLYQSPQGIKMECIKNAEIQVAWKKETGSGWKLVMQY